MSRTTLCILTAGALAAFSLCLLMVRLKLLGDAATAPQGPDSWRITLVIHGKIAGPDARLTTLVPLDFDQQHISSEVYRSAELLARPPDARYPDRHQVLWSQRPGVGRGPFRATYQFCCATKVPAPNHTMAGEARRRLAPPSPGAYLNSEGRIESDAVAISQLARCLTAGREDALDQFDALYRYVDQEIANEPSVRGRAPGAATCLQEGGGDASAKARLLTALCRDRGIPARVVTGLALKHGENQRAHEWVEAWIHNHWMSACPFYHHLGRVPASFLVFSHEDLPLVRGRNVLDLDYAFLVEPPRPRISGHPLYASSGQERNLKVEALLSKLSLYSLPPVEQRLVEFLLLLPIAALIVCIYRNVVGLGSFGTFAPALVGLAFRDLGGLPGILIFVVIVLIGWIMRRLLDRFHLLQVPRMAFLLSLVVVLLIGAIVAANYQDLPATKYVSLFPMVILTGMIERFWTLETEDGAAASFRTLLATLFIAASISLVLSLHVIVRHMFRYPETLGLIMAVQLLLGRYTGYRLLELARFREFIQSANP
jgi:hypothetical protein